MMVAYGTAARVARTAVRAGPREGAAGRPLPADHACGRSRRTRCAAIAGTARAILVVELSAGQMVEDVRLAVEGRTPGRLPRADRRHGARARRRRRQRCEAPGP